METMLAMHTFILKKQFPKKCLTAEKVYVACLNLLCTPQNTQANFLYCTSLVFEILEIYGEKKENHER